MTSETRDTEWEKFTTSAYKLISRKSQDYVAVEDILHNFKIAGNNAGGNAKASLLHLIAIKVARLASLLNQDRVANFESTEDSVLDLFNYTFLLNCLLKEEAAENTPKITERGAGKSEFDKGVYYSSRKTEERETVAYEKVWPVGTSVSRPISKAERYRRFCASEDAYIRVNSGKRWTFSRDPKILLQSEV